MNKMRFLTIGIILLFLLNAGMLVFLLKPNAPINYSARPEAASFIIEQLHLDAQQQLTFERLRHQHHEAVRQAQEEDRHLHDAYFALLKTDHPDKTKADSVATLIAAQRALIEKATFDHFVQLRALCHPDQQQLFDATIDEIARRIAPPPHERREGPPPPP